MRCIEIRISFLSGRWCETINYNMRCIEMPSLHLLICFLEDKLQHEMYWNNKILVSFTHLLLINYNMRCIEIWKDKLQVIGNIDKLQHEMYWNWNRRQQKRRKKYDKLQHEMYWNIEPNFPALDVSSDKLQHEMYWNINPCIKSFPHSR